MRHPKKKKPSFGVNILSENNMETRSHKNKRKEHDVETRAMVIAYWRRNESIRTISKDTNLAFSTVRNIIEKFKEIGTVRNKSRCGAPKKFKPDELNNLKQLVLKDRISRTESLSWITKKVNDTRTNPASQVTI